MQFSHLHFNHPNILRTSDELPWSNFFPGSITPKTLECRKKFGRESSSYKYVKCWGVWIANTRIAFLFADIFNAEWGSGGSPPREHFGNFYVRSSPEYQKTPPSFSGKKITTPPPGFPDPPPGNKGPLQCKPEILRQYRSPLGIFSENRDYTLNKVFPSQHVNPVSHAQITWQIE